MDRVTLNCSLLGTYCGSKFGGIISSITDDDDVDDDVDAVEDDDERIIVLLLLWLVPLEMAAVCAVCDQLLLTLLLDDRGAFSVIPI